MAERKIRICQRYPDGSIWTWTPILEKNPNFRSGYKFIDDKTGEERVVLDKAETQVIDNKTTSQREQILIDQIAELQDQLRKANLSPVAEPGEVPLPEIPDEVPILTGAPVEEEVVPLTTEEDFPPQMLSHTEVMRLKKEDLIVYAHKLKPDINLPDNAKNTELRNIIKKLQAELKE